MPSASPGREPPTGSAATGSIVRRAIALASRHPAGSTVALLVALCSVVFWEFLFGSKLYLFKDVGGDSLTLFYPRFVHMAEYLRTEGLPGWSFSQGFGQDIRPFSLGDPFAWILYAAGPGRVAHAFAWMEVAKLVCAGGFFGAALRVAGLRPATAALGAVLYAFSGLMVVGSAWTVVSVYGVQLALILWGFERFWVRGSPWVFPLAIAACASLNPATLAPFAFIGVAWALLRMAESGSGWRRRVRAAAGLFGLAIVGLLLSAWLSVGVLLNLAESPRGSTEASHVEAFAAAPVFALTDRAQWTNAVARTFSSDLLGNGDDFAGWFNYLEAPLFYCGLSTLVLFALALFLPDRRRRWLRLAFALVALLPVVFPYFRYAAWLFTGNYYRQLSLLVVLALLYPALRAFDALLRGFRPRLGTVLACTAAPLAALAGLTAAVPEVDRSLAALAAGLLVVYGAAVAAAGPPRARRYALPALAGVLCLEAVVFARASISERAVVTRDELHQRVGYNDHSIEAIERARALHPGFHRLNKNYGSAPTAVRSRNDAKVQGYFGTTSYYSFNQVHTIRFLADFGFLDIESEPETRWTDGVHRTPGTSGLLAVRYSLLKDHPNRTDSPTQVKVGQFANIGLYENRLFVPLGASYDRVLPLDALTELDIAARRLAIQRAAVIDPAEAPAAFVALAPLAPSEVAASVPAYDLEAALADAARLGEERVEWESISHNRLTGRIALSRTKLVFLAIPYDRGWRAEVDGAEAELIRTNVGFLGLLLPAGSHTISLRFVPRFGRAAAALSLVGLAIYVFGLRRLRFGLEAEELHPDAAGADQDAGDGVPEAPAR